MIDKPWITGPKELLVHGLEHLNYNTDFDNRMALICIDNCVELAIKSYLGLPKRINNIQNLTRTRLEDSAKSFPSLIDAFEEFAKDKLSGLELGDIEWYHRVRNELYHKGNGITVEKSLVLAYSEIAKILFKNLFGVESIGQEKIEKEVIKESANDRLVGHFIKQWNDFEKEFSRKLGYATPRPLFLIIAEIYQEKIIDNNTYDNIMALLQYRNNIVHSHSKPAAHDLEFNIKKMADVLASLRNR